MKYCEKCGKQLNDEAVFCEGCGAKVAVYENVANVKQTDDSEVCENVYTEEAKQIFACESCGYEHTVLPLFCEKCGARMRKENYFKNSDAPIHKGSVGTDGDYSFEEKQSFKYKVPFMTMEKTVFLKWLLIYCVAAIVVFIGVFFAVNSIMYGNYKFDVDHYSTNMYCSYVGIDHTVVYPTKIWGGMVRSAKAKNNNSLREVEIPESVVYIDFSNCPNLENTVIHCNRISDVRFIDCNKIEEIMLYGALDRIDYITLNNCQNLRQLVIPGSVGYIYSLDVKNCPMLKVQIPEGLNIDKYTFEN